MNSRGVCLLLALAAAGCPVQRELPDRSEAPSPFSVFQHEKHQERLADPGCMICHRAATATPDAAEDPEGWAIPTHLVCHRCHREADLVSKPFRCSRCHADGTIPPPETHAVAWIRDHGKAADTGAARCSDCHKESFCVACHARRDTVGNEVHPGTWITLHGISARRDPTSCEGCHEGHSCLTCHAEGEGALPW